MRRVHSSTQHRFFRRKPHKPHRYTTGTAKAVHFAAPKQQTSTQPITARVCVVGYSSLYSGVPEYQTCLVWSYQTSLFWSYPGRYPYTLRACTLKYPNKSNTSNLSSWNTAVLVFSLCSAVPLRRKTSNQTRIDALYVNRA